MNLNEYKLAKARIIQEYGSPTYELNQPINDSAHKLLELKHAFAKDKQESKRLVKLSREVSNLDYKAINTAVPIPEELISPAWLVSFNDLQKNIVAQWFKDIKQPLKDIAKACDTTTVMVRNTMSLEAFKHLRAHLSKAYKDLLPLEASAALRECLTSTTENVKLNAARMILIDAGLYKENSTLEPVKNDKVLDKETEERLRKLGDNVLGLGQEKLGP